MPQPMLSARALKVTVVLDPAEVAQIVAPDGKPRVAIAMGKELFYRQVELGIEAAYQAAGQTMACNMMEGAALEGVQALLDAGTVYYTAVQSVIPIAATSEISFRAYYDKLVRRDGDPPSSLPQGERRWVRGSPAPSLLPSDLRRRPAPT